MTMSHRLYLGNLDKQVSDEDIKQLFSERDLTIDNVQLKAGYAFVDCQDQTTVDSAIDKLADMKLYDKTLSVEPALAKQNNSVSSKTGCKLAVKNVPTEMSEEEVREQFDSLGSVKDFSQQGDSVHVTYSSPEEAKEAREKLQEMELQGQKLRADFLIRKNSQQRFLHPNAAKHDFPLRLLVPHQYVGAIIGRSGQTIRNITQKTQARVDVVRRDNSLAAEKMVMILGAQTENCVEACQEILKIITNESSQSEQNSYEPELRILAHNNLCGRLIGKKGVIIKAIMDETSTTVAVSSSSSIGPMNMDRVVTIKGSLSSICQAADKVYTKLKVCHEADMQSLKFDPTMMSPPGMSPFMPSWPVRPPTFMPSFVPAGGPGAARASAMSHMMPPLSPPQANNIGGHMTCFLYIPKASVGAVIGSKGSYINFVKQESRASCQVQERTDDPEANDRPVKITGYPECVWKAQWYIFDKVKSEGFTGNEYARLRCDILVPKTMIGRIIGKGGRNVRHIQDISDAIVKLPDDQDPDSEDVPVQVIGNIYSQTLAQALIRQLLTQGQLVSPVMHEPPHMSPHMRGPGYSVPMHGGGLRHPAPHHHRLPAPSDPGAEAQHDQ